MGLFFGRIWSVLEERADANLTKLSKWMIERGQERNRISVVYTTKHHRKLDSV